jgi:hypothetical protein
LINILIKHTDDDNVPSVIKPIHECQKSTNNAGMDLVLFSRPDWSQSIELIKEYNAWSCLLGLQCAEKINTPFDTL